jgi:hypothetical protein
MSCPDSPLQSVACRCTIACVAGSEVNYGFSTVCLFWQRVLPGPLLGYTECWACFLLGPCPWANSMESSSNLNSRLETPPKTPNLSTNQGASCSPTVKAFTRTNRDKVRTDLDHEI